MTDDTTCTEKAIKAGQLRIDSSGKTEKIVYVAVNRAERWSDPEERVRAEYVGLDPIV